MIVAHGAAEGGGTHTVHLLLLALPAIAVVAWLVLDLGRGWLRRHRAAAELVPAVAGGSAAEVRPT